MATVPPVDDTPQTDQRWCTHCQVIPAQPGDPYCAGCANALRAYLTASGQAA